MCDLNAPQFKDEEKARQHLEKLRWPNGPVCPHCGNIGGWKIESNRRAGLYKCEAHSCSEQFTVTVGTVFERSKIPLTKWLMAVHLLCASKKGMSSHQLMRMLGVTYKTAWFMAHRIRHAMKGEGGLLMGTKGGVVEADETYVGRRPGTKVRQGAGHKEAVIALVERNGGVRSFHVGRVTGENLRETLGNVSSNARLMTDNARWYNTIGKRFADHESVNHSKGEYVRGDVHTNTIEGVFSILKRGLIGTYHHCGSDHLHRYLSEFDFRYNNRSALGVSDAQRANAALVGIGGKRLMYRESRPKVED